MALSLLTPHFVFDCLPYLVLLGTFMSLAGYEST